MELRLILGRAGTGKTTRVFGEIAASSREDGIVLLTPEQYTHEAERELCRVCGDSASLRAEVLSFTRLYSRVAAEYGTQKYLDKGGRLLVMELAAEAVKSRLRVYGGSAGRAGLKREILAAIDELKAACVSPGDLDEAARVCSGTLRNKLMDISLLLEAFDAIAARGDADPADRLSRLAEIIPHTEIGGIFYIDGFVDFTEQETRVILALLRHGCEVTLCLTCDSLDGDDDIFEASRKTALRILREAAVMNIPATVEYLERNDDTPMSFLERNLFTFSKDTMEADFSLYRADDIITECELAAAEALRLVRETGCAWHDIAIAARGFEDYAAAITNVFEYYGVPLYTSRKTALTDKSAPALITYAMEIISGGWDCETIFEYLKTGLSGLEKDERDMLENYVYLWSVRGEAAWTRDEPWTMHPSGFGAQETEDSKAALSAIDKLRRTVAAPLGRLSMRGKKAETARGQAEILADFLNDIELAERLESRAAELTKTGREQLAAEYEQIWELCVNALEQSAALLGDMPMDQERFFECFRLVLSQYDIGTIPVSLDRVSAGDLDRMRRRNIRHLIVLGASDDRLPRFIESTGIFTDADREALERLNLKLATESRIFRELNLIYNCLTLPSETLLMSYATSNGEPSMIMRRISDMFGCETRSVDISLVRTYAPRPALEIAALSARDGGEFAKEVHAYFNQRGDSSATDIMEAADLSRGALSRESVLSLYGGSRRLSASRAETLASCRFKFFLQYGLRLKPRVKAGFDPPELGSFMHYILEGVSREVSETIGFGDDAVAMSGALADKYVERYVHEKLAGFREKSSRFVYLFRRLAENVRRVVADLLEELAKSDFRPLDFELDFSLEDSSAIGGGIVDRVDGWLHEGKLYLRIIDYKTGKRPFSLSDVWYGMGLQMLIYLFALSEGTRRYGNEIVPAGVLYAPARDVLISAPRNLSDAEIAKARGKLLERTGVILDEATVIEAMERGGEPKFLPVRFNKEGKATGDALASAEQLGQLTRHVADTLEKLASELDYGSIDADPFYKNSQDNACLWCDYFDACHFDESKDRRRFLSRLRPYEVWDKLKEKEEKEAKDIIDINRAKGRGSRNALD